MPAGPAAATLSRYTESLQSLNRNLQVIFLCGHNEALYDEVKRESLKQGMPTAVLPFHDRMSDLMNAVDLMVTKAGGLTTLKPLPESCR